MTKDLSRQLCELAGIEASKKKCNDCADGGCNGQISNEYIKQECLIYPNFKTPENFVKLLEWAYKNLQDDLRISHAWGNPDKAFRVSNETYHIEPNMKEYYDGDNLQECFLKAVIRILPSYCNQVKQALQAQDWGY